MRIHGATLGWLVALWPALLLGDVSQSPPLSSLPEPLSLSVVLTLISDTYPTVAAARAKVRSGEARIRSAQAVDDLTVHLNGRLRWIEPQSTARNQKHEDNKLGLLIKKPLFDFGRTAAGNAAANAEAQASRVMLADTRQRHYIQTMEHFFNVLLADLVYALDNERVAFKFTLFQYAQDRHEVGRLSDVQLLAAESAYREARIARDRSAASQRASRSRLALSLNRPGQLSSKLLEPELLGNRRKLPEVAELEAQALTDNPKLRAASTQVEAAREHIKQTRARGRPVIYGELEASAYTRKLEARDPLRVGVLLEMPLYLGDQLDAEVAQQRAELSTALARRARLELELRQELLEIWLELETLYAQREEASVRSSYRDLSQDRSLALFELERRTDLEDSLIETTAAALHTTRTEYQIALAWARLDALTGAEPETIINNALKGVPE